MKKIGNEEIEEKKLNGKIRQGTLIDYGLYR